MHANTQAVEHMDKAHIKTDTYKNTHTLKHKD